MLDVTPRFLAAVAESHRVSIAATIMPPTGPAVVAEVIGGQLRLDRDARVRRQGSLTVGFDLDTNLEFVRALPFGGYVQLARGILYADGVLERPVIATLRVNNVSWSQTQATATLDLADRMAQVQDEPFPTPWAPNGIPPSTAIVETIEDVFGPDIEYHVLTNPAAETPLVDTVFDQDRGQAVSDLASSVGATASFDALGDFVLAPNPPDADTVEPVWEFDAGEGGTLVDVQENLDRSAVRNGIAVRGQAAADSAPIYSLAVDADPSSPTMWGGPFGKVAMIVSLNAVQSQAQADSTAASLLNLRLGLARTVTLRGVPNPALEPDDVILASYPDGREEPLRINAVQLALDTTSAMELTVTGHYHPDTLTRRRSSRRAFRVFGGAAAWRELQAATVRP
jgi:hypothetical protein